MAKLLTDAAVRKYAPAPKRRRIPDAGTRSLFLIIEPSGRKSWQMRFRRPDGKPGKLTLGPYDSSGRELSGEPVIGQPLSLAAARQLAASVHRERNRGRDVIADHKAAKHRRRTELVEATANTFAAAVQSYIDEYARPQTRNWRETARLLGLRYRHDDGKSEQVAGGLMQRWASRDVRSIDHNDIWAAVDEARRQGVPGIKARNKGLSEARARSLFVVASSLFGWLKEKRRIGSNPCAEVPRPAAAQVRDRVLTPEEVRWFWRACDTVGEPFAAIFRLLLLTGARLNEVAGMRRDELNGDGMWSLPGSRTKNKRPHMVPLPPSARDLIPTGKHDLVFTTTGTTPPSGWSRAKRRLDKAMLAAAREQQRRDVAIAPWRLHDLRRTAVTNMAELGIRPDVIELTVNHISGTRGGIAGVYNRSELLSERKLALERWAAHVAGLVSGDTAKVVSLRRDAVS